MSKVVYRAILHGPMSWKTSHQRTESNTTTPYLVIFEPTSSVVMLSQGTLLIPQISVFLNKLKSQILSVFVYHDSFIAKELVSDLYNYLDKNMTIFDVYKNEKTLKLLSKSLASVHLPLEVVLKRVDYNTGSKFSSRDYNSFSTPNVQRGLKTNIGPLNTYDSRYTQMMGRESISNFKYRVSNTVTNNLLNHGYDPNNKFYNDEPKSVKSSSENTDSYNLRVGLDEGFYVLTTSTDLMQKLFQSVERKGPRVNRLSLSFYKITKTDPQLEMRLQTNTVLNGNKYVLNSNKNMLTTEKSNYLTRKDVFINCLTPNKKTSPKKDLNFNYLNNTVPKVSKGQEFYTPGMVRSPLLSNSNYATNYGNSFVNDENHVASENVYTTGLNQPTLTNILRSLTNAIDKNTEAINLYGVQVNKSSHNYSYSTETNMSNEANEGNLDLSDSKQKEYPELTHGLASMSTHEFFGYGSPSNSNSNNFNNVSNVFALLSDTSSDAQIPVYDNQNSLTEVKLDDLQLRPFDPTVDNYFNQPKEVVSSNPVEIKHDEEKVEDVEDDNFIDNYAEVLEKISEPSVMCDLCDPEDNVVDEPNDQDIVLKRYPVRDFENFDRTNEPKMSSRTNEKKEDSFAETDSLSEFTETSVDEAENVEKPIKLQYEHTNATNVTEKSTTFREDEEFNTDIESPHSCHESEKSDLNVLIDEFNELSNKNEMLTKDNFKYRSKINKLKEKINNIKSLHKFEMDDVMNNNFSNEEKLRSTINECNVTIKMMEQERLKLTEMLEQHKMTIKRLNREKVDAVQQLSRLEDEYNKLQMVREMDKNEKYTFNKTKVELEQYKSDNEVLINKLRVASEKLQKFQHNDKLKNELVTELKDKVERLDGDRIRNVQLSNENKLLKSRELQTKERLDQMKKEHLSLRNEYSTEKSNNMKLSQMNQELQEEVKSLKSKLNEYEAKDDKLESKMSMLESNNTVLLKNLESSKNELEKLKKAFDDVTNEKNKFETRYQQLQSSVEKVESMNQTLSGELLSTKKLLEEKTNENTKLSSQLYSRENELCILKHESTVSKESHEQLVRDYNFLTSKFDDLNTSYKNLKKEDEGLRHEIQSKNDKYDDMLRQLQTFKFLTDKFKAELETRLIRQRDMYYKLLARFFWLMVKYNGLKKENSINKIKINMMAYKNKTVLIRQLVRSVLLSKAKVAKRNCQLLKIVTALQMSGPTTCSMILSKINTLVTSASDNNSKTQDKMTQLKSSFMKHSMEKDQKIKVLQTQLVSLDQLKENQQFLLEENRNLTEKIMEEQNNSQKLQQALNEQIERERFAFESESKSLYNRQYELLKENDQLSKENYTLKESLNSLLKTNNSNFNNEDSYSNRKSPTQSNLYDVKYARLRSISNPKLSQETTQTHYSPPYINSPNKYKYTSEFEDNFRYSNRTHLNRMVYHNV